MKSIRTTVFIASALGLFLGQQAAFGQLKIDCKSVEERVKTAVEGKPVNVLTIVEDALVAYSGCVDSIVKSAIEASDADADLVKQIVLVAVTTAEKEAPQIAEAAVAAAPEHADAVRAAFAEAFEKKAKKTETTEPAKVATTSNTPAEKKAATEVKSAVKTTASVSGASPAAASFQSNHPEPQMQNVVSEKAVIGEVEYSGKEIVADSGKQVVESGGKTVIYDNGTNYLSDSGKGIAGGGKDVAYDSGYHIGSPATGGSRKESFGYGPVDLAGVYLIPPVASAAPVEEKEVEEKIRIVRRFTTRRIFRSVPMSPTSP